MLILTKLILQVFYTIVQRISATKNFCRYARTIIFQLMYSEERNPSLLHGKVGAFMAKNKYGITDEEILSAITWHTTGKDNMTDLEKIVFCADYIEPGRTKQPHLEELRSIALSDLDMLTFRILEDTVEYLKAKSFGLYRRQYYYSL